MSWSKKAILGVLDQCAEDFTFPVLDNGYVYLAATRLSVYHSDTDWALVIEVFGFSPRAGLPDVQIYTFSSKLHDRDPPSNYVSQDAYENYLNNNPHNESRFVFPIENSAWQDQEDLERLSDNAVCVLRGIEVPLPEPAAYADAGIELEDEAPLTFEFCRYLAKEHRNRVLCTERERRVSVLPNMTLLLQLEDWCHPDVVAGELPSASPTFQQLAEVLETGSTASFSNDAVANTHWRNWPEGGTL
ncbi:hypothetical protein MA04_02127 [Alcanivorax balearicus MACL04]|uniref:DUF2169 domain-containing protein n=1 Tax=Alloalcanivorax balearicus MACL04 TaxID=1177182 RepID=A0ABT2QZ77_9GAMM|nr:hypothetical protein [Alloalcanivorax balearicus]MCU5782827.1 hypothetical protein [Alloalcanivorax balearicus MACL04]